MSCLFLDKNDEEDSPINWNLKFSTHHVKDVRFEFWTTISLKRTWWYFLQKMPCSFLLERLLIKVVYSCSCFSFSIQIPVINIQTKKWVHWSLIPLSNSRVRYYMKLTDSASYQCFIGVLNHMHVTKLASIGWMITLWIIIEIENKISSSKLRRLIVDPVPNSLNKI